MKMPILPASYYRPIFSKWRVSEKVNDDRIRFQPSEIAATSFLQRNPKLKYISGLSPTHCGVWECGGEETVRETMEKHSRFTKSLLCPWVVCQSFSASLCCAAVLRSWFLPCCVLCGWHKRVSLVFSLLPSWFSFSVHCRGSEWLCGAYLPERVKSRYCSQCSKWKPSVTQHLGEQILNADLIYLQFRANCFVVHYRQL